jgi:hypothetical protein
MNLQTSANVPVSSPCSETCLAFTARLWLRTALVVWAGWLGLLGALLVRM